MKHELNTFGRRIDLNLIVAFEAIYRTRNVTIAGKDLGLSQPAMSHALSRLRWVFKDPLFVKIPGGMGPTALADHVAPALFEGLATIRAGIHTEKFDPATTTRTFTITMSDLAEAMHLPVLLQSLKGSPSVRIRTLNVPAINRRAALADGQLDLALANDLPEPPIHHELLGEHGYKVIARADHPLIRSKLTLASFKKAKHVLVMPVGGAKHGEAIERVLRSSNVSAQVALQVASFYPVASIVTGSDLIAMIPEGLAVQMAKTVGIRAHDAPVSPPKARIYLCWHERSHRDLGNAWLREAYVREAGQLYGRH